MRTVNAPAQALLARLQGGEPIPVVQLLRVELDPVLYLTTAGVPLVWDGRTWQPAGLAVQPIEAQVGEFSALEFVLPAVTEDQLALVLGEQVDGVLVRVFDAIVDPDSGQVADAVHAWAGTLNSPGFSDGAQAAATWTAEHRAVQAYRAKPSRYTDDAQQRLYPGDTSMAVEAETDSAALAWPAASYFYR